MVTRETPIAQSKSKFGNFKPVAGTTGYTLHVLNESANHSKSMNLLDEAGLMPFERQEILPLLMKDAGLKNTLTGKWFYLAGKGLNENGIYTVDDKGELVKITDEKLSIEMRVRAWKGSNPLSLGVYSDDVAAGCGRRFDLNANGVPDFVAPVVVGKPKLSFSLSGSAGKLLKEIRLDAGSLEKIGTQEELREKVLKLAENATNLEKMLRPAQL